MSTRTRRVRHDLAWLRVDISRRCGYHGNSGKTWCGGCAPNARDSHSHGRCRGLCVGDGDRTGRASSTPSCLTPSADVPDAVGSGDGDLVARVLSCAADGASLMGRTHRQAQSAIYDCAGCAAAARRSDVADRGGRRADGCGSTPHASLNDGVFTTALTLDERRKALDEGLDAKTSGLINHTTFAIEHFPGGWNSKTAFEPRPHPERSHDR